MSFSGFIISVELFSMIGSLGCGMKGALREDMGE
jgi:hypothetical protein